MDKISGAHAEHDSFLDGEQPMIERCSLPDLMLFCVPAASMMYSQ